MLRSQEKVTAPPYITPSPLTLQLTTPFPSRHARNALTTILETSTFKPISRARMSIWTSIGSAASARSAASSTTPAAMRASASVVGGSRINARRGARNAVGTGGGDAREAPGAGAGTAGGADGGAWRMRFGGLPRCFVGEGRLMCPPGIGMGPGEDESRCWGAGEEDIMYICDRCECSSGEGSREEGREGHTSRGRVAAGTLQVPGTEGVRPRSGGVSVWSSSISTCS